MTLILPAAALAVAVVPPGVAAQNRPLSNLQAIAIMNGSCSRLVIGDKDASDGCVGKVTNTMYKTGRSGFTFLVGDLAIVTFSGLDTPARGDVASIRLDHVIFSLVGTGTKPNSVMASGSCRYTNPYAGPSHVNCSAATKSGKFSATFVSDGRAPEITKL